ncbi:MAG: shikimate dehydrogenase [bacterium]
MINAQTKICLIIGDPVKHSLSPAMHNAAYEALGIHDQFVYLGAEVKLENLAKAISAVRTLGIHGLTCTMPHKLVVLPYLDEIDPIAKTIGAVNTIINQNGKLIGYNTDWLGVRNPLVLKSESRKLRSVAILGAGGAARAAIYAVQQMGAIVTIFNRTLSKAEDLAKKFNCNVLPLSEISKITKFEVIINSSAVGMSKHQGQSLVPAECLDPKQLVFEMIYHPQKTKLILDAEKAGAQVIYGYEMLLEQALEQFKIYTGKSAPREVMQNTLLNQLK